MRRRSLVLLLAAGVILSTTGQATARMKITWWAPAEYSWTQMARLFEKQNPGVDVQIVNGDLDKFYTMITAGLMPDIWGSVGTPGISADVNRNWALDLSPYIKRDSKAMNWADFFPGVMRQFKVNGRQYGMPMYCYADYFFYNKQLYAKAGLAPPPMNAEDRSWNWEQMVVNAQKTTVRDSQGKTTQGGIYYPTGYHDFPNYMHMWGAEPYSSHTLETSVPQSIEFSSPEMVNALTKVWELSWRHRVVFGDFKAGKTAASLDYGYTIPSIMLTKSLPWAIAPLPWAKTNTGTFWPGGWRIAKVSKDKDLAWSFVKFLFTPENMRLMLDDPKSTKQGSVPIRRSLFNQTFGRDVSTTTGMKPEDVLYLFDKADSVGIVKYQETVCLHADVSKQIQPELDKIWSNRVDPKSGAANIQKAIDRALPTLFQRWLRNIKFTGADRAGK